MFIAFLKIVSSLFMTGTKEKKLSNLSSVGLTSLTLDYENDVPSDAKKKVKSGMSPAKCVIIGEHIHFSPLRRGNTDFNSQLYICTSSTTCTI